MVLYQVHPVVCFDPSHFISILPFLHLRDSARVPFGSDLLDLKTLQKAYLDPTTSQASHIPDSDRTLSDLTSRPAFTSMALQLSPLVLPAYLSLHDSKLVDNYSFIFANFTKTFKDYSFYS